jgi:hypothetical protein
VLILKIFFKNTIFMYFKIKNNLKNNLHFQIDHFQTGSKMTVKEWLLSLWHGGNIGKVVATPLINAGSKMKAATAVANNGGEAVKD